MSARRKQRSVPTLRPMTQNQSAARLAPENKSLQTTVETKEAPAAASTTSTKSEVVAVPDDGDTVAVKLIHHYTDEGGTAHAPGAPLNLDPRTADSLVKSSRANLVG